MHRPKILPMELKLKLKLKRAYDPPSKDDGCRILVDRLWPRGLRKDQACVDDWLKEIAPSTALRKWFADDPARWEEFRQRYFAELESRAPVVEAVRRRDFFPKRKVGFQTDVSIDGPPQALQGGLPRAAGRPGWPAPKVHPPPRSGVKWLP